MTGPAHSVSRVCVTVGRTQPGRFSAVEASQQPEPGAAGGRRQRARSCHSHTAALDTAGGRSHPHRPMATVRKRRSSAVVTQCGFLKRPPPRPSPHPRRRPSIFGWFSAAVRAQKRGRAEIKKTGSDAGSRSSRREGFMFGVHMAPVIRPKRGRSVGGGDAQLAEPPSTAVQGGSARAAVGVEQLSEVSHR